MSVMTKFTRRSLAKNRMRTIVTILGVALSAALITAIFTCVTSLEDSLSRSVVLQEGPWHVQASTIDASELAALAQSPDVDKLGAYVTEGFIPLLDPKDPRNWSDELYLGIQGLSPDAAELAAIWPSEGSMPEDGTQILLPDRFKGTDGWGATDIQVGSTITVPVVQRKDPTTGQKLDTEAAVFSNSEMDRSAVDAADVAAQASTGDEEADKNLLAAAMAAFDAVTLTEPVERTFTVTGFVDFGNGISTGYFGINAITMAGSIDDIVAAHADDDPTIWVQLTMHDIQSQASLTDRTRALMPGASYIDTHNGYLMWMGYDDGRSIFNSLYGFAGVLAVVIFIACVSLIYNAFAISVGERTRAYGLLSSIGATKRQLRMSVVYEAGFVALIGIPLGIVLGIVGCAVTFYFIGGDLEGLMTYGLTADRVAHFTVSPRPWALGLSALITLLTVFVSAWIPSIRAGRVSAIDAIRSTQDVRAVRRQRGKRFSKVTTWDAHGIDLPRRVFGVPGALSSRNSRRSRGRNFTSAACLALALVLLMTAGSLDAFLKYMVDHATPVATDSDVVAGIFSSADIDPDEFGRELESIEGIEYQGWSSDRSFVATMPASMVNAEALGTYERDEEGNPTYPRGRLDADRAQLGLTVITVGDDDFKAFLADAGVDASEIDLTLAAGRIPAIAVGTYTERGEGKYVVRNGLISTGTMTVFTTAGVPDAEGFSGFGVDTAGTICEISYDAGESSDDVTYEGDVEYLPVDSANAANVEVEVLKVIDVIPDAINYGNASPIQVIVPAAALRALGPDAADYPESASFVNVPAGSERARTAYGDEYLLRFKVAGDSSDGIVDQMRDLINSDASLSGKVTDGFYISDITGSMIQVRRLVTVAEVFCMAFTIVLTLIAVANVFNTIANGLILRTREFAILRSVGMGDRAFRRMIMSECCGYVIAGLIPGLILSGLISWSLYRQMLTSFDGEAVSGASSFLQMIPWGHLALAILIILGTLALSVAYGLHRAKANNVVEALRADAM